MPVSKQFLDSLKSTIGRKGTVRGADVDLKKTTPSGQPLVGLEQLTGRQVTPDSQSKDIQPYVDSGWLPQNPTTEDIQALSRRLYDYKVEGADPRRGALPPDPGTIPSGVHPQAAHRNAQDIGATIAERQGQPSTGTPEELDKYARMTTVGGGSPDPEMNNPVPEPAEPGPPAPPPDEPLGASREMPQGAGAGQGQGGGVAGGYVAAHEVAMADPERQAQLQRAFEDEARARLLGGDIAAHGQDVAGEGQEQAAAQQQADLDQVQANQTARQEYLDRIGADIEKDSRDLATSNIDPARWWKSRTTPQQILGVIAMALGGFGASVRGGRNSAADQIEAAITEDIAAQRTDLENKWAGMRERHTLLADRASQYGNIDVAEKSAVAARLHGALLQAQGAAARATAPVEKAQAAALVAALEQKSVEAGLALNKWIQSGYVNAGGTGAVLSKDIKPTNLVRMGDTWVDVGDSEVARQFNVQNMAAENVVSNAKTMLDLLNDPSSANPFSAKRGLLKATAKQLTVDDIKSMGSGTRGGKGMLLYLNEALGNYEALDPIRRAQSRQALQKFISKAEADNAERARQLDGRWTVRPAVDPSHPESMQITGRFSANSLDNGTKPANAMPKTLKLAGQ
jgi:hypothetical protein